METEAQQLVTFEATLLQKGKPSWLSRTKTSKKSSMV